MSQKFIFILINLLFMFSCGSQSQSEMVEGPNFFGDKIDETNTVNVVNVAELLLSQDTLDIKVDGTISSVCQNKGCWMTLTDANMADPIFIKFKDYGFFVPKNSTGKKAILSGKIFNKITSVDELRHYAEDKGETEEFISQITEPKKELNMMADGVIIFN